MMNSESYTPGHTQNASDFMAKRTLETHGAFFVPYLDAPSLLDCGCGPGTITLGIARYLSSAEIVGVDFDESQIRRATETALHERLPNIQFKVANCYSLPFANDKFDRIFSHALLEHLADPALVVREMYRVLKPNGFIGLCSPDWGGFILTPPSLDLTTAVTSYTELQSENGGDVNAGRKLGTHLEKAGFHDIDISARYECYSSLKLIGEYLAVQLENNRDTHSAAIFRKWSRMKGGMFAQTWISAVAKKPRPGRG